MEESVPSKSNELHFKFFGLALSASGAVTFIVAVAVLIFALAYGLVTSFQLLGKLSPLLGLL
jgi:hypothetical protein